MKLLCEAIHPEFRVYCGLEKGHLTDHVGLIGQVPVVWPNSDQDDERVARVVVKVLAGLFIAGAILSFACAFMIATG